MYIVDIYRRVRRAHYIEGKGIRETARLFNLHRQTVRKMLEYSVPPGYQRKSPPHRPKLAPYQAVVGPPRMLGSRRRGEAEISV